MLSLKPILDDHIIKAPLPRSWPRLFRAFSKGHEHGNDMIVWQANQLRGLLT